MVRDRIPEIIAANRQQAVCSMLDGKAYQEALRQKLREETEEHLNNRTLEELADILEKMCIRDRTRAGKSLLVLIQGISSIPS